MMEPGKISKAMIRELFEKRTGAFSGKVMQGPAFGVDTAIIDLGGGLGLAVASDPLSLIPSLGMKESAWLSVILISNDIATTGYLPQFAQFVLNLPLTLGAGDLEEYWSFIHQFCNELGVSITGGHTGFDRMGPTTLSGGGTMFAVVELAKAKSSAFAKPGHDLVMTKSAAISSGAILAMSFPAFTKMHLGDEVLRTLANSFYQTSVAEEVKLLNRQPALMEAISAMHDVTEGGILGAVFEMTEAAQTGVYVEIEQIPVAAEQHAICKLFDIDPLRSIGVGSMLIACGPEYTSGIVRTLQEGNISATVIGRLMTPEYSKVLRHSDGEEPFTYTDTDPYWAAFAAAMEKGLT